MSTHTLQRPGQLYEGLYPAVVKALGGDPDSRRRIEVEFPWLPDDGSGPPRAWATPVTPYADDDQGFQMLPEIGSTVVVGFQAGYLDHPYVVGSVWNGKAPAPEQFDDSNDKRLIRTRSGSLLEFDDTSGVVKITLSTRAGHHVVLDEGAMTIDIQHSSGNQIRLTSSDVVITANATVKVTAPMVEVDAAMSKFTGIVQCDTLIAQTSVVSPSYTPGAGNVW